MKNIESMSKSELESLPTGSVMFFDVECYINFFYIRFKSAENGKYFLFEQSPISDIDFSYLSKVLWWFCIVGFNSKNYDLPVISLLMTKSSCFKLKKASDFIIKEQQRSFAFEKKYGVKIQNYNHIDLIELCPLKGSLKLYGGRINCKTIQDLPINEDEELDGDEAEIIRVYCDNDLDVTELIFDELGPQLQLRVNMGKKYGIDLRSKSDAQIAEAVLVSELEKKLNRPIRRPSLNINFLKYNIPDFIKFESSQLKEALDIIRDLEFELTEMGSPVEPPELKKLTVCLGQTVYNLGMGGLHSKESCMRHIADDNTMIVDNDVASYYPNIILNQGLFPEHIGPEFLEVYRRIVDTRIDAKGKAKTEKDRDRKKHYQVIADSLKITINGSFGKFGNKWSALYSPQLMLQTTITGQLCLLMLIERLESKGIDVVSGNTDGVVSVYHKDRHLEVREIIESWEQETNFDTEETQYSAIYNRDVNSYIAFKNGDGDPDSDSIEKQLNCKTKGAFSGLKSGLSKNPTNIICLEAVLKYLKNKTSIEETVKSCTDITKFVTVRNVKGGAVKVQKMLHFKDIHNPKSDLEKEQLLFENGFSKSTDGGYTHPHYLHTDGADYWEYDLDESYCILSNTVIEKECGDYLGKVVRFYYAKNQEGFIEYKKNGNMVPRSTGAKPLMTLPDSFPTDVDFDWYVKEAIDLLYDCGGLKKATQLRFF